VPHFSRLLREVGTTNTRSGGRCHRSASGSTVEERRFSAA
jgi:hypothetical protein